MNRSVMGWVATAIACALWSPGALAQQPESWAYQMTNELMSPFCPGRTLADCPSQEAETLRVWIGIQAAAGRTWEDVESELLERYGNGVLAAPKAEGFGLAAYVIPIGLFLTGGGLVVFVLRRFTSDPPADQVPVAAAAAERLSDAELERIVDDELASGGSGSERA